MAGPYVRGPNPYGGDFAAQGLLFREALQQGWEGNPIYAAVAPEAAETFLAPIAESHCIGWFLPEMPSGDNAPINGFCNALLAWFIKFNLQAPMGMPVPDGLVNPQSYKLVNGVYQVSDPSLGAGGTALHSGGGVRTLLGLK